MKMHKLMITCLFLFGSFFLFLHSALSGPLDNWHWRNPLPQGSNLWSVAWGKGAYVAVGEYGAIVVSFDGAGWTPINSGTSMHLTGIAYGNDTFAVVGLGKFVLTSPDGIIWTARPLDKPCFLKAIVFGNGIFVAVGERGMILTSPDGSSWRKEDSKTTAWLRGVTYGDGVFVAVGEDTIILTSSDGRTWQNRKPDFLYPYPLWGVAYGNDTFVAVGGEVGCFPVTFTSPDGNVWTRRDSNVWYMGVTYGNGVFVAVGPYSTICTSLDGIVWENQSPFDPYNDYFSFYGVGYGNNLFVTVGEHGRVFAYSDGASRSLNNSVTSLDLHGVAYGGGVFVGVGYFGKTGWGDGTLVISTDGATWTEVLTGTGLPLRAVAYGKGKFVAVGDTIITSPDGQHWTENASTSGWLRGVAYGNGCFVAVGWEKILRSTDGVTWTEMKAHDVLETITYGNGLFVAAGCSILTSPDGAVWTIREWCGPVAFNGVTWGGGMFVGVGMKADGSDKFRGAILTSSDGIGWGDQSPRVGILNGVVYGPGGFVVVGDGGVILSSPDGGKWTSRVSRTPDGFFGVAFGSNTFVVTGANGAILQSDRVVSGGKYPDLSGQWVFVDHDCKPDGGGTRCKFRGGVKVENIGGIDAPSSSIRFYLSGDGINYTEDSFLKQVSTGRMKTSRGKVKKLSYSLPSGKSASGKYIIAVVDANNTVTETDETNNEVVLGPLP